MRQRMINNLREYFDNGGLTHPGGEVDITDFAEVEAMNDEDLLELYEWVCGFQG